MGDNKEYEVIEKNVSVNGYCLVGFGRYIC